MKLIRMGYVGLAGIVYAQGGNVHMVNEAFIAQHMVSRDIADKLDEHCQELGRLADNIAATPFQKHGVWKFNWLPGYYVKYNVSRLTKRELLNACIQEEKLHLLQAPEKFLYHIKGRPTNFSSLNYLVICKTVHDSKQEYRKRMDLEQVQQFIKVIEKTGHLSTFEPNFLRLPERKISFIDTDGTFNTTKPNTGFIRLLDRNLSRYYKEDALDYIIDKIALHLNLEKDPQRKKKCLADIRLFLNRQTPTIRKEIHKKLARRTEFHRALRVPHLGGV